MKSVSDFMLKKDELNEVSNELLTRYKDAAGKDASDADKKGDFKRGDKRFHGIVRATIKQFDNDKKNSMKTESTEKKKEKEKEDDTPPFDPPYETKNRATPGKYGKGYSTARHLARMAARKAAGMKTEEVEQIDESDVSSNDKIRIHSPGHSMHGMVGQVFHRHDDGRVNVQFRGRKKGDIRNLTLKQNEFKAVDRLTKEDVDSLPPVPPKSRKADIVRSAYESAKSKKKQKESDSKDKFQADPELSTQILRND